MLPLVLPLVGGSWQWGFAFWSAPVAIIALLVLILAPRPQSNGTASAPRRRWWPDWGSLLIWRLGLMLGTFSNTAWVLLVLSVVAVAFLACTRSDVMPRLFARVPALRPGLVCVLVLIVLATVLNDSGVQVTGMMGSMTLASLTYLATRLADREPDPSPPDVVATPDPSASRLG